MKKHSTLIIVFNAFDDGVKHRYKEIITDAATGEVIEDRDLARAPRAARFDEVHENGSGDHNQWNAHKAKKLYSHPLLRK